MGGNSWFAKMAHFDPIASSSFGKYIDPLGHSMGTAYGNRRVVGGQVDGPYNGVQPTLADANAGYVQQSQRAAGTQRNVQPVGQSVYQAA